MFEKKYTTSFDKRYAALDLHRGTSKLGNCTNLFEDLAYRSKFGKFDGGTTAASVDYLKQG